MSSAQTQTKTKTKTPREHYDDWCRSESKQSLRTCILRLAWKSDQKPLPGKDNAHWADVEWVARGIETMRGPKPTWEYLKEVAEVVRGEGRDNHRPLVSKRNQPASGIERRTADISMNGGEVRGHARSKVAHQAQWLVDNKDALPEGLVWRLGDMLHNVKDADTGKPMIDRRALATAGRDFRTSRPDRAPTTAVELERVAEGIAALSLETTDAQRTAIATAAAAGDVRFNRDLTVDERSAAVRRGDLLVRDDGSVDRRSSMLRAQGALLDRGIKCEVTAPVKAAVKQGDLRYKQDGSVDARSAAVRRGDVILRNDGQVDGRSRMARAAQSSSASASLSASSRSVASGPTKADGTPDMRYAANRGGGGKGRK